MPKISTDQLGAGQYSSISRSQVKPPFVHTSKNLVHSEGNFQARIRNGIDRLNGTRVSNNPVLGLYQYVSNAGAEQQLAKINGNLYSFPLDNWYTPLSQMDSGWDTNGIARFTQFLNFWVAADDLSNNYIGNGGASYPFGIAAPTDSFTATISAGSGLTAGAYNYDYARYSTITGELSPARGTAVSATTSGSNLRVTLNAADTIAPTEQFDQVQIYRTKVGGTAYWELTKISVQSFNDGYIDSTADASLVTVSTIHTSAGAANTSRIAGARDVAVHRGRLHFIGSTANPSRQRWTQLLKYEADSTTDARNDIDPDDGDDLMRGISHDGNLFLFKRLSIHVMNGDVDQTAFTWQVISPKSSGIGAYCPHTAVSTPFGIVFLSACGIYVLQGAVLKRISDRIGDVIDNIDMSRRDLFVGIYDPCLQAYMVSITRTGQTINNQTLVYFFETGAWSIWEYGAGLIGPASVATFVQGDNKVIPFFGSQDGYLYETQTSNENDGVCLGTCGDVFGTSTSAGSTSMDDSTATFRDDGDGITGTSLTIRHGTNDYESRRITTTTPTEIGISPAWTTIPANGTTYYLGGIDAILSLGYFDMGNSKRKRFTRISVSFGEESHSRLVEFGYTIDDESEPSTVRDYVINDKNRISVIVNQNGTYIAPYIRLFANAGGLDIVRVEIEYRLLESSLPGGRN